MKQTALRYGLYAMVTLLLLSILSFLVFKGAEDYGKLEVAGYLTMILSTVFVFFGLKHFRDHVHGSTLSLGKGLKLGLLISLVPALGFGAFDILYTRVINPRWHAEYMAQYSARLSGAERAEFEQQMVLFANPFFEFALMALTVFIIGLVATIISALILKRAPKRTFAV